MSDTPMYCDRCDQTVQKQGPCPKGGNHQLMSISDKGVQGQGPKSGPESEKSSQPAEPADSKPPRKDTTKNAKVASNNNDYIRREAIRVLGHDSGDGETVYHCPFCFTESVRFITKSGIKTFGETVGTIQTVLTAEANDRTGGRWVQAEIKEFGEQAIMEVTLQRNGVTQVIEATPEHRWLVKSDKRVIGSSARSTNRDVFTKDLKPGHRLSSLRPSGVGDVLPSDDGIRHGIVFGDGTAQGRQANVTLWGEKDKQLLKYFPNRRYFVDNTASRVLGTGIPGVRVCGDLWAWMKAIPEQSEDVEYLYGWLAGYFAADGTVSKQGQVQINSANLTHLEAVRDIAIGLGISVYGISMKMRQGFPGRELSALYTLEFLSSSLNEEFFLIEEHYNRWLFRNYGYERFGWTVVSVRMTDRIEKVYCAVVPETHSFALADNIWVGNCGAGQVVGRSDGTVECGFCKTHFTVQVQPEFNPMPQTVDGQPNEMPGMPYGGDGGGQLPPPGEDPNDPTGAQPGSPADEEAAPDPNGNGPEEPPIALSSKRYYLTREGALDEDAFVRHLALAHSSDRQATLSEVRSSSRNPYDLAEMHPNDYYNFGSQDDCQSCHSGPAGENGQCRNCNREDARERDAGI